ncbi:MAG: hypothetical protein K8S23_14440 [Candidatus Cloacimonetes bacterium]|nr:hypothetical protein [Candidatus Cloacimonadota bacterium]
MVIKKDILLKNFDLIPDEKGVFTFFDAKNNKLYFSKSSNLRHSIKALMLGGETNKDILQLASLTENISFVVTENLFEALLIEKKMFSLGKPDFNNIIQNTKSYVYLAIDFYNVPFFKVVSSTIETNYYYIGPFHSNFFIRDFLETMMNVANFPACETQEYPCEHYKNNICKGYCILDKIELNKVLISSYFKENSEITKNLRKKYLNYQSELNFEKAQSIYKNLEIIEKYYRYIYFFHCTKHLTFPFDYNNSKISLKNGLIEEIGQGEKIFSFAVTEIEYKDREFLAIERHNLNEAWIIFQYLREIKPLQMNRIYNNSITKMFK